jgi:hypothetical protein
MRSALVLVAVTALLAPGGAANSQSANGLGPATAPGAPPSAAATAAVTVLRDVCVPLLGGGDLKSVATGGGLKLQDGEWVLPIDGKRRVELQPPDQANPHLCGATITHRVGSQPAILSAVDAWAKSQSPPLQPVKVRQQSTGATSVRTTSTWQGQTAKGSLGVVLTERKTLTGAPVAGELDRSTLLASLTPS